MKVRDLMTKTVASCRLETNLAAAGALMWQTDCGVLPVIDDRKRVVGVLTDRDACIALTTKDLRASAITVGEVATGRSYVCNQDDDIHVALKTMSDRKVHRLPVVNKDGMLEGILSLNDIVLHADAVGGKKHSGISYADVAQALQSICAHPAAKAPSAVAGAGIKVAAA